MQQPRRRVVRARQRDRAASFPGFDRNLVPLPDEWMVDRLLIHVDGRWRTSGSGRDFCLARLTDQTSDWLLVPDMGNWQIEVSSRKPARSTFGSLYLKMKGVQRGEGRVEVVMNCNPTRTLANLIARYSQQADFLSHVASLSTAEFFAFAENGIIPNSLDPTGRDNYIAHRAQMLNLVGGDFSNFIPIFIQQCQVMLARLLSSSVGWFRFDGQTQHIENDDGEVLLEWGEASVPQIESYFERFHLDAISAVRTAGLSILARDSRNTLRRYSDADLERNGDCFLVSVPLTETRKLVVYAKTANRIRFEVRRHGRARYTGMPPDLSQAGRICAIVAHEREKAIGICRWQAEVGPQFDEPQRAYVGDLIELVSKIVRACDGIEPAIRTVLARLMSDGGISVGLEPTISHEIITKLEKAGVLKRVRLRRRETNMTRRYGLSENFRDLRETLDQALSQGGSVE